MRMIVRLMTSGAPGSENDKQTSLIRQGTGARLLRLLDGLRRTVATKVAPLWPSLTLCLEYLRRSNGVELRGLEPLTPTLPAMLVCPFASGRTRLSILFSQVRRLGA